MYCPIYRCQCDGYDSDYETCSLPDYACPHNEAMITEKDCEED